jgi:hypothetical protein
LIFLLVLPGACKAKSPTDASAPDQAAADLSGQEMFTPADQRVAIDQGDHGDQGPGKDLPIADLSSVPDLLRRDLGPLDLGCAANTQTDPHNCGSCGHACPAGDACCAGTCSDPQSDAINCGTCGHSCEGNACCAGRCTSLDTIENCGGCGMQCKAGRSCCEEGCTDKSSDPQNCGFCGQICPSGYYCIHGTCTNPDAGSPPDLSSGCLNGGASPPAVCTEDPDPKSGAEYVVCRADCTSAWVAHAKPGGGTFAYQTICQLLGYSMASEFGGTCGDICGYCEMDNSCMMPGTEKYDGGGSCGSDCLSATVMWKCVK